MLLVYLKDGGIYLTMNPNWGGMLKAKSLTRFARSVLFVFTFSEINFPSNQNKKAIRYCERLSALSG